ncbi:MAG: helix-turn-helix transcriptional regulator [Halanaeroarchaeum sp.]
MEEDVVQVTELLARRLDLLEVVSAGPTSKRTLVSDLDVSRSTVDRAVRSLESAGIVHRRDGAVTLTTTGEIALRGYRDFHRGLIGLRDASPLFRSVDPDSLPPFSLFVDATVVTAKRESPHQPIRAFEQFLEDAERIQTVWTGLIPDYVDFYNEQVVDRGMEADLFVRSSVLDDLLSAYWEPIARAVQTGRLTLYEVSDDPPLSIKVAETGVPEVGILTYGSQGISGFIRSDDVEGVEWAKSLLDSVRGDAVRVAPLE